MVEHRISFGGDKENSSSNLLTLLSEESENVQKKEKKSLKMQFSINLDNEKLSGHCLVSDDL
jgi:hypothetical protein